MKRIAFLVSGGDAPGINACIAGIYQTAQKYKIECKVIFGGLDGLIDADIRDVCLFQQGMENWAGSVVPSGRSNRFLQEEWQQRAIDVARNHAIDGLIVMGGDGSLRATHQINQLGLPCVCVPVTIDNDVWGTDYSLGFETGIEDIRVAVSEVIQTGCAYPGRIFFIETLGGPTGHLALAGGIAGGASLILLPEFYPSPHKAASHVKTILAKGQDSIVIVGSEGLSQTYQSGDQGISFKYNQEILKATGVRTRISLMGYAMRGKIPSGFDSILGKSMGCKAVETLVHSEPGQIVVFRNNHVETLDIAEVIGKKKPLNPDLLDYAQKMGVILSE